MKAMWQIHPSKMANLIYQKKDGKSYLSEKDGKSFLFFFSSLRFLYQILFLKQSKNFFEPNFLLGFLHELANSVHVVLSP